MNTFTNTPLAHNSCIKTFCICLTLSAQLLAAPIMAAERFAPTELTETRPRLFMRQELWKGGYSLSELRARATVDPYAQRTQSLRTTRANLALKWLLLGDEDAANEALKLMKKLPGKVETSYEGTDLIDAALAYDWLHTWQGFTKEDQEFVAAKMINLAHGMRRELSSPSAHPFHTRMYAWTAGLGIAGLALYGDHPEGAELFEFARKYYETELLPARKLQGGAIHNAFSYGLNYMMFPLVQFLEAAKSGANVDYFHTVNPEDSDWLREMADFLQACILPDFTHVAYADSATDTPAKHFRFMFDILAAEYKNSYGAWNGEQITSHFGGIGYHAEWFYLYMIFNDPTISPKPPTDLPASRLFSPDGVGHVFMRNNWGKDATVVHFRCGDYFENHGHFDQGSFTLFYRRPLALKTCGYWDFDSPYRHHYFKQAISCNTVIFSDPDDPEDEGRQRNFNFQSAGTFTNYLAHKSPDATPSVETGNILAFNNKSWFESDDANATFAAADVTPAWDKTKVARYVRQLALVNGKHLIVVDEIDTTKPSIRARWLLHTAKQLEQNQTKNGETCWSLSYTNSSLQVRFLSPVKPVVAMIGGPGRECEVNGVNYPYVTTSKFIKTKKAPKPIAAYGLWRMEAEHAAPSKKRLFVAILSVGNPTVPEINYPIKIKTENNGLNIYVGETKAVFKKIDNALLPEND